MLRLTARPDARTALFFDFDDTLHDFHGAYIEALEHAVAPVAARARPPLAPGELARRCLLPWARAWEHTMVGRPDAEALWRERSAAVLEQAGLRPDATLARGVRETYLTEMEARLRLFPDALPALHRARAVVGPDGALGLLTNGPGGVQRARLRALGLLERFAPVVISDEVGCSKPDPAFFAIALRAAAVRPQRAVLIGDNPATDVAGAGRSGLGSVWLARAGAPLPADRRDVVPDATAGNLMEAVERAAELLRRRRDG